MSANESRLEVATLINHVANQIRQAWAEAQKSGTAPVMEFSKAEIEVVFEVEYAPGGKINLWAVQIGAKLSQKTTHRLKIECVALEKSGAGSPGKMFVTRRPAAGSLINPVMPDMIDPDTVRFAPIDPRAGLSGAPGLDLR